VTCSSSVCELLGRLALLGPLVLSCRSSYEPSASAAPPAISVPVGPIPGPNEPAAPVTNPYEGDRVAEMEGRTLFNRYNCSGCHGDHAGGGMGPSLRDASWIYGQSPAKIFRSVADGRAHGMPAWGVKIPEQQVWKLVAYVRALRTDHEPSAPDQSIPPGPHQ
jgi:cytochrome c oxidase cbb3-type subunit 3